MTVIDDQPPTGGCKNCGRPVRTRKEAPGWPLDWWCHDCIRGKDGTPR